MLLISSFSLLLLLLLTGVPHVDAAHGSDWSHKLTTGIKDKASLSAEHLKQIIQVEMFGEPIPVEGKHFEELTPEQRAEGCGVFLDEMFRHLQREVRNGQLDLAMETSRVQAMFCNHEPFTRYKPFFRVACQFLPLNWTKVLEPIVGRFQVASFLQLRPAAIYTHKATVCQRMSDAFDQAEADVAKAISKGDTKIIAATRKKIAKLSDCDKCRQVMYDIATMLSFATEIADQSAVDLILHNVCMELPYRHNMVLAGAMEPLCFDLIDDDDTRKLLRRVLAPAHQAWRTHAATLPEAEQTLVAEREFIRNLLANDVCVKGVKMCKAAQKDEL